jgi:N-acetylglucosamine-6-phosphate deacetylase
MKLGVGAALVGDLLVAGDVAVEDGRIAGIGLAGPGRGIAVPGFLVLQVNGFGGVDFLDADAEAYRRAGAALLETGVTAFLPTLITSPEQQLLAAIREVPCSDARPRILGLHLEGPFLSPNRLGTHEAGARRDPDPALLQRLLDAGPIRMMTLAPELPGALDLVDRLLARGVTVSLGHSDATAEQANLAFARGARSITHLFNAMRPFFHRDPGIAGAALAHDGVTVSAIVDGVHLAPETVQATWRAKRGRFALVTDAIAAAPRVDGPSSLGELDVHVHEGAVRGPDGVLAGSVVTMIESIRNLHGLGVPLEEAVAAATIVPARVLGLEDVGRLDVGLPADVVVLNDRVEIERVLVGGDERVSV